MHIIYNVTETLPFIERSWGLSHKQCNADCAEQIILSGVGGGAVMGVPRGPCWLCMLNKYGILWKFTYCSWPELVVGRSGWRGGSRWDGGGGRTRWWVGGGSVGLREQVQVPLWGGGKVRSEGLRQCTDWYVARWCKLGSHSPLISREICIIFWLVCVLASTYYEWLGICFLVLR